MHPYLSPPQNSLTVYSCSQLGRSLSTRCSRPYLRPLHLKRISQGCAEVEALVEGLVGCAGLRELSLAHSAIGPRGAAAVA